MIYKFSQVLELNYDALKNFMTDEEELTKEELIQRCSGEIDYTTLQSIKELVFDKIGKTAKGELYLT